MARKNKHAYLFKEVTKDKDGNIFVSVYDLKNDNKRALSLDEVCLVPRGHKKAHKQLAKQEYIEESLEVKEGMKKRRGRPPKENKVRRKK